MLATGVVGDRNILDHRLVAFPIPIDADNWALALLYFPADLRKVPAERRTKLVIYSENGVKTVEIQRTARKIVEGWVKVKSKGGAQPRFGLSLVTVSNDHSLPKAIESPGDMIKADGGTVAKGQ